ncbi:MAG TPA: uridine kinase [Anaerolineae bacterium]|nr:uridine kinase [Anaerolineae bacterium]HNT04727.1 uridine kinase [Anaerolineae bacterium]HOU23146.1 uridine kinase [Anaerolineae bacterium]HQJ52215.1 uridine kinase [Anaerolineae bacterium]
MGLVKDKTGRLHIETQLMAESLMDKALLEKTETENIFRPLPELNVIKLGGQSIIDRGAQVVLPLMAEIVAARAKHQMLIVTGGGTRSRHAYAIALDLGMSTGILAKLGQSISEQNALMISTLLAPHGGVKIGHDEVVQLPAYLALGIIPVMHAMPPYGLWEEPAEKGRIPPHRTDAGAFLTAEVLGARRCILVKDEKGLFTADPKKDPQARFIPEIEVNELLAMDLADLAVERTMLQALANARTAKEVLIINGREKGNLTKALQGKNPGTRIFKA